MQMTRTIRNRFFAAAALATILCAMPVRAHAASKEIIQLQTQVQQLLDMVQRLQTTMDTRFAVLQNLAQQTSDQAVQMNGTVTALQQKMNSTSGVNIDTEMSNLISIQNTYAANAHVMSVVQTMMTSLMQVQV